MADDRDAAVAAIWETLIRTGVAGAVDPETTITPSAYQSRSPDELSLPPPLRIDPSERVQELPLIRVREATASQPRELVLGELLGEGGMGSVHTATQVSLRREVAVKRLHDERPDLLGSLLREARITGSLEHPNIVPVHVLGRDEDGRPVLVMKRFEGTLWASRLKDVDDETRCSPAVLDPELDVLIDLCNAVHYAHSRGVVHRDIKPQNVLIGEFGEVVLLDWGVAARMGEPGPGQAVGTPGFMAPEMAIGDAADARTDVYLLGATLHRLLTGKLRHHKRNTEAALYAAHKSAPARYGPEVPPELGVIANKACARHPGDRFPTAVAFRDAVTAWRKHRTSQQMAHHAVQQLTELRTLLAATRRDDAAVAAAAAACRFGLEQSLAEWPENPGARIHLRECLELLVPWHLETGDAISAEQRFRQLQELAASPAAYAELGQQVAQELKRARALSRLAKELDMSVASGWRVAFLALFAAGAALYGGAIVGAVRLGAVPLDHRLSVGVTVGTVGGVTLGLLALRRWVLATVANRRVMFTLYAAAWGVLLHRIVGWWQGTPVEHVFAVDLFMLALAAILAGVAIDPRLFGLGGFLLATAFVAVALPSLALEVFSITVAASLVGMILAFSHWIR